MNKPIDLSETNYGLTPETWAWMQNKNKEHLESHPICEICGNRPSVRITAFGDLLTSCMECYRERTELIQEEIERDAEQIDWH